MRPEIAPNKLSLSVIWVPLFRCWYLHALYTRPNVSCHILQTVFRVNSYNTKLLVQWVRFVK